MTTSSSRGPSRRPVPSVWRSYAEAAARWRVTFETFWHEARWIEGAIAATARRYLGGEPLLFPEDTEALARTLQVPALVGEPIQ